MINLRTRILLPTSLIVGVVLSATILLLRWQVEHSIAEQALGQGRYIRRLFQARLIEHSDNMTAMLLTWQHNPAVIQALKQQDRDSLLELSLSLFEQLRSRNLLASFAYLNSDRAPLLRVENPDSKGFVVDKTTTLAALQNGEIARGLEFDDLAQLHLWIVAPWYEKDMLIGYVELGTSIDQLLLSLTELLDPTLYVALNKKKINQVAWQNRQRLTHNAMDWDRFPEHVVVAVESNAVLPEVVDFMKTSLGQPISDSVPQLSSGEFRYCLNRIPIVDANNNQVAEILALVDITHLVDQSNRASTVVIGTVSLVGFGLLAVLFLLANFTQRQLVFSKQALVSAQDELNDRFLEKTEKLRRSERDYRELVQNANSIILRWTRDGRITFFNQFALDFFGFSDADVIGRSLLETIIPKSQNLEQIDLERMVEEFTQFPVTQQGENEFRNVKRDGTEVWISWTNRVIKDDLDNVVEILSTGHDISGKKSAEKELELAASVFENIVEGVMITSPDGEILRTNRAYALITGFSEREVLGKTPESFIDSIHHGPGFYRQIWETLAASGLWQGEVWNKRRNDESYPQWLSFSVVRDADGNSSHYVGVFSDITEQKNNQEQIYRLAHFDSLTGLPNRILFQDRLSHALTEAKRNGVHLPILFLDLDRFKLVNDSMGHGAGDLLLQQVAKRLAKCVRASDTLARMGGDEFTIILGSSSSIEEVMVSVTRVSHNIVEELKRSIELEDSVVIISTSIGVAVYPQDGESLSDLLRNADMAMYHAKQESSGFSFYQSKMNAATLERLNMEQGLYKALEKNQFEIHYQPCVRITDGMVETVEALVRWHHPSRGLMESGQFLGFAEKMGLVSDLGEWVLSTAVNQAAFWRDQGLRPVRIAVNVSPFQIRDKKLVEMVQSVLDESGFPPDQLVIEVTESMFLDSLSEQVTETINDLYGMGVRFSIDDFGIGNSSLTCLKLLPIDTFKVDRSCVAGLLDNENDATITQTVIDMAHRLRLNVVAEGVETEQQFNFLKLHGCDFVQGNFLARPAPASEIEKILGKCFLVSNA